VEVKKMKKIGTALAKSKYILKYCNEKEITDCSNKKMQKLLYYTQAWSLALRGKKIFDDDIEAWLHGPVVRQVYDKYKEYGFDPIPSESVKYDESCFTDEDLRFTDSVLEVYCKYDADYLEYRTHVESPWQEGRRNKDKIIALDSMKSYYKEVYDACQSKE
jgi:uncharacterized phage-associated protein